MGGESARMLTNEKDLNSTLNRLTGGAHKTSPAWRSYRVECAYQFPHDLLNIPDRHGLLLIHGDDQQICKSSFSQPRTSCALKWLTGATSF